jgi:hypothetical protein
VDTSNPPPPDGNDSIGPKWGADYRRRHPDDDVPGVVEVDQVPDDAAAAGPFPAPGQVLAEVTGPIGDGARLAGDLFDTADLIDPEAPDPEPAAVLPSNPDWVDPCSDAVPVDPQLLHDATANLAEGLDLPPHLLTEDGRS